MQMPVYMPLGILFSLFGLFFVSTFGLLIKRSRKLCMRVLSEKSKNIYVILHRMLFPASTMCEALIFTTTATIQLLRISFFFLCVYDVFHSGEHIKYFHCACFGIFLFAPMHTRKSG